MEILGEATASFASLWLRACNHYCVYCNEKSEASCDLDMVLALELHYHRRKDGSCGNHISVPAGAADNYFFGIQCTIHQFHNVFL